MKWENVDLDSVEAKEILSKRKSMKCHFDNLVYLTRLTYEQIGRFYIAQLQFGQDGTLPDFSDDTGLDAVFFSRVKFMEQDKKEYVATVVTNRENGQKGGRPPKT